MSHFHDERSHFHDRRHLHRIQKVNTGKIVVITTCDLKLIIKELYLIPLRQVEVQHHAQSVHFVDFVLNDLQFHILSIYINRMYSGKWKNYLGIVAK